MTSVDGRAVVAICVPLAPSCDFGYSIDGPASFCQQLKRAHLLIRIFLSHSGSDTKRASDLKRRIEAAPAAKEVDLRVWLDIDELIPGSDWQEQLEHAVEEADAFAVLIGGAGVVNWVDREVRLGLERATGPNAIAFLPIRDSESIDWDALPPFARQFHGVTDPIGDEAALAALIAAVTGNTRKRVAVIDEPFVGLRAMDEVEADRFFGRDDEVAALAALVRIQPIVAVVADSGAGKSSLVRAGLVPAFRGGVLAGENRKLQDRLRHVVVMRPGSDPLQGLRDGIDRAARGLGRSTAERRGLRLSVDPGNPAETAYALRADLDPETTDVLLVVDQFEELLTQTDAADAGAFVDVLTALADPKARLNIRIVLTVRADYYNLIRRHDALFGALESEDGAAQFRLKRISEAGLADVVQRGLSMAGHSDTAERDVLLAAINRDTTDRPGDLALIQMALYATWRHARRDDVGLLRAYSEVQGVLGALAFEAERVRTDLLTPAERDLLLPLFARLVTLGDTGGVTRRGALLDQLGPERGALARKLATEEAGRLLMITGDKVEVAHEALVAQWPWLQEQIQAHAGDIRTSAALNERTSAWQLAGNRGLPNPAELTRFMAMQASHPNWLFAEEHVLIRKARSRRILATGMAALAAVLIVVFGVAAGFFAVDAQNKARTAEKAQTEAEDAQDAADLARAEAEFRLNEALAATERAVAAEEEAIDAQENAVKFANQAAVNAASAYAALARIEADSERGDPLSIIKLALAAWPNTADAPETQSPEIRSLLSAQMPWLHRRAWATSSLDRTVETAEFSGDGRFLLYKNRPMAMLYDAARGLEALNPVETHNYTLGVALSPDGRWFASSNYRGQPILRNLETHAEVGITGEFEVTAVGFSADGSTLLYADGNKIFIRASVGDPAMAREVYSGDFAHVTHLALSPDGRMLAFTAMEGENAVFFVPDVDRPLVVQTSIGGFATSLNFDQAGSELRVGIASDHGMPTEQTLAWDILADPEIAGTKSVDLDDYLAPKVFKEGEITPTRLDYGATAKAEISDNEVTVHFMEQNRRSIPLFGWEGTVLDVVFSDDAARAAILYLDGTIHIWDLNTERLLARHHFPGLPAMTGVFIGQDTLRVFQRGGLHAREAAGKMVQSPYSSADGVNIGRVIDLKTADATVHRINRADDPDTTAKAPITQFWPDVGEKATLSVARSGDVAAVWTRDYIRVYVPMQSEPVHVFPAGMSSVTRTRFSGSGRWLVASVDYGMFSGEGTRVWNVETGLALGEFSSLFGDAPTVWFSPDEDLVLIGSQAGVKAYWTDLANGNVASAGPFRASGPAVANNDGTRLFFAGLSGIEVFDFDSAIQLAQFDAGNNPAIPIRETEDGRILFRVGEDYEAWDFSSIPEGNGFQVACVWLPDHDWENVLSGSAGQLGEELICPEDYDPPSR